MSIWSNLIAKPAEHGLSSLSIQTTLWALWDILGHVCTKGTKTLMHWNSKITLLLISLYHIHGIFKHDCNCCYSYRPYQNLFNCWKEECPASLILQNAEKDNGYKLSVYVCVCAYRAKRFQLAERRWWVILFLNSGLEWEQELLLTEGIGIRTKSPFYQLVKWGQILSFYSC